MPSVKTDAVRAHGIGVKLQDDEILDMERWNDGGSALRMRLSESHRSLEDEQAKHFETQQRLNMWRLAALLTGGAFLLLVIFGKIR